MRSAGDYLGHTSPTQDIVLLGVLGVALYVVYQLVQGVKATAQGVATAAGAVYHGTQVLTSPVAAGLASAWTAMTSAPSMPLLGNVVWPDGTQTALSQLTLKQDNLGNVYASDGQGLLFQLQPSNAQGNWPAVQITDPSQIGQAPAAGPASNLPFLGGAMPGPWEGL